MTHKLDVEREVSVEHKIVHEFDTWPLRPPPGKMRVIYDIFNSDNLQEAYALAKNLSEEDIKLELNEYKRNYVMNIWEAAHQKVTMSSFPTNVSIPIADLCNARCSFCDSWLRGSAVLSESDLELFAEPLRFAKIFGIQGHGEPLVNPNINLILNRIRELVNPHAKGFLITNGVYLPSYWRICVSAGIRTFNISLNAASSVTHQKVMGLGDVFDQIINSAVEIQNFSQSDAAEMGEGGSCNVTFSFVLTSENIEEALEFIELSERVGVSTAYIRTLLPLNTHPDMHTADDWYKYFTSPDADGFFPNKAFQPGLNYHLLHPSNHKNYKELKAKLTAKIKNTKINIDAQPDIWDVPALPKSMSEFVEKYPGFLEEYNKSEALKSRDLRNFYKSQEAELSGAGLKLKSVPQKGENPLSRKAPMPCSFVYQSLLVNESNMRMVPCCNMSEVPGHEPSVISAEKSVKELLNSEAMINLRSSLSKGPLFDACKVCTYNGL